MSVIHGEILPMALRVLTDCGTAKLHPQCRGFKHALSLRCVSLSLFSGSQSEESENSDVKFVITPYTLKLIGTPLYVKPTLPYNVKVRM